MTWWDSLETLSKLQTALAILISVLGIVTLAVKLRGDQLKKRADAQRSEERARLDKQLTDMTAEARELASKAHLAGLPRSLSGEQRAKLIAAVRSLPKGKIAVKANMFDSEAETYAKQIKEVLTSAGAEMVELAATGLVSLDKQGGAIIVMDRSNPPPHAQPLAACFLNAGIDLPPTTYDASAFPRDVAVVWISRK